MKHLNITRKLNALDSDMKGDLFTDSATRLLYATDASMYRSVPVAVAFPKDSEDIRRLICFAGQEQVTLIPRTAGTSLAGQVVGDGIVVDVSRYMNDIMWIDRDKRQVRVQPGVVLDELNLKLKETGLFFAPETSTSNRCMIGGMVGNNACGSHSLLYGSTREHLSSVRALLSDGSEVTFEELDEGRFMEKTVGDTLEARIYAHIHAMLADHLNREEILREFPDPEVKRRNTGYALDMLLPMVPFTAGGKAFNFCSVLAGSEGTLAFLTEIQLKLVPLPPRERGLICIHFTTLEEALEANVSCLAFRPGAVELMDHTILECTRNNIEQRKNRFFLKGDPGAILIVEFARDSLEELHEVSNKLESELRGRGLGYHFPLITGKDIQKVWALRKSGLGVLTNTPGDAKPVSLIEDTAVRPDLLVAYVKDFKGILEKHGLECVFHAHAGTGELHLRPIINIKDPAGVALLRTVATEVARLVKKYRGSFSGEHGDGRLRSELIPLIVGEKNYSLMRQLKQTWDPGNVFNKGKITDPPPLDRSLRYTPGATGRKWKTVYNYMPQGSFVQQVEMCNGSGDCRKSAVIGGLMCPSYMATLDEHSTTRARANLLREYLNQNEESFTCDAEMVYEILDLCLSCKGCKSECPSNVDMAKFKSEFLQHYYDTHGVSLSSWLIANLPSFYGISATYPAIFNFLISNRFSGAIIRHILGFDPQRPLPLMADQSLRRWISRNSDGELIPNSAFRNRYVYLFIDEFTGYNDVSIGITAIRLLTALGYGVKPLRHRESGRTSISKGFLRKARRIANANVISLSEKVDGESPLLGIEPSALLSFRDEYPDLVRPGLKESARQLAQNCLLIDEFIAAEADAGRIERTRFTTNRLKILLHGHCQQKSIASTTPTIKMLSIPENYTVEEIPSGCCGMAGAFGYEKKHRDISRRIGEMVLFPAVRSADEGTVICAPGTSCRCQIKDGTGVKALHPVEVLYQALIT